MDGSETATDAAFAVDWNATILDSGEVPPPPPSEDELWVGHVRFAIEGVAQGSVGLIGLVGKWKPSVCVLALTALFYTPFFMSLLKTAKEGTGDRWCVKKLSTY